MTERSEVYAAIDGERAYQDKWADLDTVNSIGDFLAYMQRYLRTAVDLVHPAKPIACLDAIRKVTALGVACMENHGAPQRGVVAA